MFAFGAGRRRAVFFCGSLYPTGRFSAALRYKHVKVRVRVFEQSSQRYRFYRFSLLAVIILRFINEQDLSP